MEQQNDYTEFFEKAQKEKQQGRYDEALNYLNKAKHMVNRQCQTNNPLDSSDIPYFNKIRFELEIAKVITLKSVENFEHVYKKSESMILECRTKIDQYWTKQYLKKKSKETLLYTLYSNYGDLMVLFAENYQAMDKQAEMIESIEKCLECFGKSREICYKWLFSDNIPPEKKKEYQNKYAEAILNLLHPLAMESQKTGEQLIAKIIIELSKKIQAFYHTSSNKKLLKRTLAKTYYYVGASHKMLGNSRQAIEYLQRDYQYCQREKLSADLQKTKGQIINYYLHNQNFKKVEKYIEKSKIKALRENQKQYQEFRNQARYIVSDNFFNNPVSVQKQALESFIDKATKEKWTQTAIDLVFNRDNLHKFTRQRDMHYYFYYGTAEILYDRGEYTKGFEYEKQALGLALRNSEEYLDQFTQHIYYLFKLHKPLSDSYEEFQRIIHKTSLKPQDKKFYFLHIEKLQFLQRRRQYYEKFQKKQINPSYQKQLLRNQIDEENEVVQTINQSRPSFIVNTATNLPLQGKYLNACQQSGVTVRKAILNRINNNQLLRQQIILLSQLFFIPETQILTLINVFELRDWNFRNFKVTQGLVNSLLSGCRVNFSSIKSLKIANSISKFPQILKLISKLQQVQTLHLQKINLSKKLLHINDFTFHISKPMTLKVLKLKNCSLTDNQLPKLLNFPHLETLNLHGNYIKGQNLKAISQIKLLETLNLSGNPLSKAAGLRSKKILSKLKIKHLGLDPAFRDYKERIKGQMMDIEEIFIFQQISNCQRLDLTENHPLLIENILECLEDYCGKKETCYLKNIRKIIINKINVTRQLLMQVNRVIVMSPNLLQIDMRFCYWGEIDINNFIVETIQKRGNPVQFNYQGQLLSPYHK